MVVEDVLHPQTAHVFVRGNPNNPGVETPAHFLSCLSPGEPAAFNDGRGRLDLAMAVASKNNPLTALVIVDRFWMLHFGAAIVRPPIDFALRGDPPAHLLLLGHLSGTFILSGSSL